MLIALFQAVFAIPDFIRISKDSRHRTEIISQCAPSQHLTVPAYSIVRKNFFQYIWIEDITSNPDNPFNQFYAKYYNLSAIETDQDKPIPIYWKKR